MADAARHAPITDVALARMASARFGPSWACPVGENDAGIAKARREAEDAWFWSQCGFGLATVVLLIAVAVLCTGRRAGLVWPLAASALVTASTGTSIISRLWRNLSAESALVTCLHDAACLATLCDDGHPSRYIREIMLRRLELAASLAQHVLPTVSNSAPSTRQMARRTACCIAARYRALVPWVLTPRPDTYQTMNAYLMADIGSILAGNWDALVCGSGEQAEPLPSGLATLVRRIAALAVPAVTCAALLAVAPRYPQATQAPLFSLVMACSAVVAVSVDPSVLKKIRQMKELRDLAKVPNEHEEH